MKTMRCVVIGAVVLLFTSAIHCFAIEGLKISVQSSNVILSWPSTNGETYVVQYRPTLNQTSSWTTLTDFYPAATGTNITFFVHSNVVQYPQVLNSGTNGGGDISPPTADSMTASLSGSTATTITPVSAPMVMPANGSGDAIPLAIFPPGFNLSGFIIFDPATGEWVNGSGYLVKQASLTTTQASGAQPLDDPGTDSTADPGFYRVVRDGAHLWGITNGVTLSGIVTIPVEVANGYGNLSMISLTENDSPVGNSIQIAPFNLPLALIVDTTQMSNGVHQISASARWDILGSTNDETDGGLAEADSPPVTVNIYNEISFPNWMPEFGELGNSLLIRATSAHTNADWYIDIYDSQYSYIGTFGGHTANGDIVVAWNLIGPYNEPHTNDNFFIFVVTTVFSNSSSMQSTDSSQIEAFPMSGSGEASVVTPKTYKHWEHWSGHGAWVIVAQHAWDTYLGYDQLYAELNGFIQGAQGSSWTVLPSPQNGNAYALNFSRIGSQGDSDWANFRQALYDARSRNLVYLGHGGSDGLGYNPANNNRYISASEISNLLHTTPAGQTNRHSFRFVFLDGCSTAKGTLPEAFGILHKEDVSIDDYTAASMRPSAFVGWPEDKMIGLFQGGGVVYIDHVNFITYIQLEMSGGGYSGSPQPIKQAIINASTYPNLHGFSANSLKVFGYWGLKFGLYN